MTEAECDPFTFLQERAEVSSLTSYSGISQSAPLNGTQNAANDFANEHLIGSPTLRYMNKTSETSTPCSTSAEAWISSQQEYLAHIGQTLEQSVEVVSTVGQKLRDALRSLGRDSSSSNASVALLTNMEGSKPIWKQLATASVPPFCSMPPAWALLTLGSDIGLLATPTAVANQTAPEMIRKWVGCRRLAKAIRGRLIPAHYEWMMGWPIGWTALERSVMVKSRCKRLSHGESS